MTVKAVRELSTVALLLVGALLGSGSESAAAPFAYLCEQAGSPPQPTNIAVVDTATNSVTARLFDEACSSGVAVSPDGSRAYVSGTCGFGDPGCTPLDPVVFVIDTATNRMVATIGPIIAGQILVAPSGTRAYATGADRLWVMDTTTNSVLTSIPGIGHGAAGLAIDPSASRVYVVNSCGDGDCNGALLPNGTVSVVDTATNGVLATITVGVLSKSIALDAAGTFAYVTNACGDEASCSTANGTLSVIDTATNTVVDSVALGTSVEGVAVTGTHAYVAGYGNDRLLVVDTVSRSMVASVPIGQFSTAVAARASGDRVYALSLCARDANLCSHASVTVVDTTTNGVVATIPVGFEPPTLGEFLAPSCFGRPDGTACDDGNGCTESDRCTAGICAGSPVASGSACDDGNPCTRASQCDGGGHCVGSDPVVCTPLNQCHVGTCEPSTGLCSFMQAPDGMACVGTGVTCGNVCTGGVCGAACGPCEFCDATAGCVTGPAPGCRKPVKSHGARLVLQDAAPRLTWKWTKGQATSVADFGDPVNADSYSLCMFDQSGHSAGLVFRGTLMPGAGWEATKAGPKYRDRAGLQDGITSMTLHAGPDGKAKISVGGGGSHLTLPGLPLPVPLAVQLQGHGQCWSATFTPDGVQRDDAARFKARSSPSGAFVEVGR